MGRYTTTILQNALYYLYCEHIKTISMILNFLSADHNYNTTITISLQTNFYNIFLHKKTIK